MHLSYSTSSYKGQKYKSYSIAESYREGNTVRKGNTAEVKTLKRNLNACKTRFALGQKNVTLVFDRGIVSEDNAVLIEEAQMKYISALDRNQIPGCGVSLEPSSRPIATKPRSRMSSKM